VAGLSELEPLWLGNAKIATDFAGEMVVDLGVPWDRTAPSGDRMMPPRMAGTLAKKLAAVSRQMLQQITAFHTAIGSSS
jgi:hypothetical protein